MARKQAKMPLSVKARALSQAESLPGDLQYLVSIGISRTNIARELGVSRRELYEWWHGRYTPRLPQMFFAVVAWAEYARHMAVVGVDARYVDEVVQGKVDR